MDCQNLHLQMPTPSKRENRTQTQAAAPDPQAMSRQFRREALRCRTAVSPVDLIQQHGVAAALASSAFAACSGVTGSVSAAPVSPQNLSQR